ncbi:(-)-germacrene D synthase-like isoform X2 [Alnus glutinosa]|uniref:(-)-germacrene D synthase-like isoform X2 n=1 Tax=Alnus glutinosa TaxID=3517 RepID=UPI002D767553|nr:(-)-germacrene D synthase-like isoform X2 [Alnus glutinosa]
MRKINEQVQELKGKVRKMLMAPSEKSSHKLNLVDVIQCLRLSYHFENKIQEILQQSYKTLHNLDDHDKFAKFIDNKGKFKESLINDARGMLSLYEAAHLRVHGEDILDDRSTCYTATHLEAVASHLSPPLAAEVLLSLNACAKEEPTAFFGISAWGTIY